ncbi:MAG: type 1 glutamine amidotransferase [Desulfobacteraceae bacterium]|nr:type 1 glutamine amidotransferase [Desulfobacteraceae bacterium]
MKILILQNCEYETLGTYERYLVDSGMACDVVHTYQGSIPDPADYSMLLIGGTPDSAYNRSKVPYLAQVYETITDAVKAKIPCFGVCCGAQLLAEIIGGQVHRNPEMEIGGYRVTLTPDGRGDPLLEGFPQKFPVFHWHGDTFDLPHQASLLARGEKCQNQLFRYGTVAGVQFHLEVTSTEARQWALRYAAELTQVGKSAEQVVAECQAFESEMQRLAARLMQNYLALIGKEENPSV